MSPIDLTFVSVASCSRYVIKRSLPLARPSDNDPIAAVQTASSIACKPPFNCYEIAIQHCDVTKVTIQLAKFVES